VFAAIALSGGRDRATSSYAKSLLGPVDAVTAPDSSAVIITYRQPFGPLLQGLSVPYLGIQSPAYLRKAESTTNTVVGSAPFVLPRGLSEMPS
jgi:peptide/nickel transport system substrate-binding protein